MIHGAFAAFSGKMSLEFGRTINKLSRSGHHPRNIVPQRPGAERWNASVVNPMLLGVNHSVCQGDVSGMQSAETLESGMGIRHLPDSPVI